MSELKFKPVPYDIVTSASTGRMTVRGTDANAPYNSNLLNRLQAIVTSSADNNMFNEEVDFGDFSLENLQELLTQVAIRFDNDPNYYTKRDYQYLIWYLCKSLKYLENNDVTKEDFNNIQKSAEELLARIESLEIETDDLKDWDRKILEDIENLKKNQQVLEAGSGIMIKDEIISSVLTEDIQVYGVNIGEVGDTDILKSGTPIVDILKQMLQKKVKVKLTKQPSVTFSPTTVRIPYGASQNQEFKLKLTQGTYESEDLQAYNYKGDFNQSIEHVTTSSADWSVNGVSVFHSFGPVTDRQTMTLPVSYTLSEPKKIYDNTNNEQNLGVYKNGTVTGTLTIIPTKIAYYGLVSNKIPIENIERENIIHAAIIDEDMPLKSSYSYNVDITTDNTQSICIIVPKGYVVDYIINGAANAKVPGTHGNWQSREVTYEDISGYPEDYTMFLYPLSTTYKLNNITIKKK